MRTEARPARVLLVPDRPGWAYDAIVRALVQHNSDPLLQLDVAYAKGCPSVRDVSVEPYDLVFVMGWPWLRRFQAPESFPCLRPSQSLTGVHSHRSWENDETEPDRDVPPPAFVLFLNRQRGVNVVSRRLYRIFKEAGVSRLSYTPNGVDTDLFRPLTDVNLSGPLRVGFVGDLTHDRLKGLTEFIEPACAIPGVELRVAAPFLKTGGTRDRIPFEEMPAFYGGIDVYVCASSSEGFSLSVLEAAACGRPVISTRVGGSEELIIDGVNGFLVDRDVEAIRHRIRFFVDHRDALQTMGSCNREIVERDWS